MADARKNSGEGSIPDVSPKHKKRMYETEYKHAANLLDRSLDEYAHAKNEYKKEAFRKVMAQALQVLKDTASELKQEELMQQCHQIEKDYQTYQAKETPEAASQLHTDLEQARKHWKK